MSENKTHGNKKSVGVLIFIALFMLVLLVFGGQSARLSCIHTRQPGVINCIKQSRLLWIIPLGTRTINNVSGARIRESADSENGTGYRVELLTPNGVIPLTPLYTSGFSIKQNAVDQINAFLQATNLAPLELTEPGLLSTENCFCMLAWFPIVWVLSQVGRGIKSLFGR